MLTTVKRGLIVGLPLLTILIYLNQNLKTPDASQSSQINMQAAKKVVKSVSAKATDEALNDVAIPDVLPVAIHRNNAADPVATNSKFSVEQQKQIEAESLWVKRRQIVRPSVTLVDIAKRVTAGEDVKYLSLPAFDGQEYLIELDDIELYGQHSGSFAGKIAGHPSSDVVVSFYNNAQSGVLEDPSIGLYLSYDAYADGQVIVKQIDMQALAEHADCDSDEHQHQSELILANETS